MRIIFDFGHDFEKKLSAFNGSETMCTLLNIAWFNYEY